MPRKLRTELGDGTYHVTSRGNRRQTLFADDGDRRFFLELLGHVADERAWRVQAYCLLNTHYHLVIETAVSDLSAGMQRLNGTYAQSFNSRHGIDGHLFQGRFYAGVVEAEGHLLELTRYLALNPVRAGLSAEPTAWRWSSYGALVGQRPSEPFLAADAVLRMFAGGRGRAREVLRAFVEYGDARQ